MRKIHKITKHHIGKFLKFFYDDHYGGVVQVYEYILGIGNINWTSYDYVGYYLTGPDKGEFYETYGASASPNVGYWLPVSELEIAVVVPELLERAEQWKQK